MAAALWSHRSRNLIEVVTLSQSEPYPENPATLDGLFTPVSMEPYMEDLDNNQLQPNQPHDIANDTVAQLVLKTEQIMTMTT